MDPLKIAGKQNPFQRGAGVDLSKTLIEQENAAAIKAANEKIQKYKERMAAMVVAIDKILCDNDVTWQEWGEIIETFNSRNAIYFNKVLLSSIKNREYAHTKPSTGGKDV